MPSLLAEVGIIKHQIGPSNVPSHTDLFQDTANGLKRLRSQHDHHPTHGCVSLSLTLGLHLDFTWPVIVADIWITIISVDILIDCWHNCLHNRIMFPSTFSHAAHSSFPTVKIIWQRHQHMGQ